MSLIVAVSAHQIFPNGHKRTPFSQQYLGHFCLWNKLASDYIKNCLLPQLLIILHYFNLLYKKPDSGSLQLSADSFPGSLQKKPGEQENNQLVATSKKWKVICHVSHYLCLLVSPMMFSVSFTSTSFSSRLLWSPFLLEMQPITSHSLYKSLFGRLKLYITSPEYSSSLI